MSEGAISHPKVTEYIRNLLPPQTPLLEKMKEIAGREESYVPIVQPEVAQLITMLCQLQRPKKVLEVGTGMGYSAIMIAEASPSIEKVVTIERFDKVAERALSHFKEAGKEDTMTLMLGDAREILPSMDETFDLIFLDAAKGQYMEFFSHCLRCLRPGGLLISDNVLYQGMIADPSLVVRRKITIVKRLRSYLQMLMNHEKLTTSLIPIGDGVALSYKKV